MLLYISKIAFIKIIFNLLLILAIFIMKFF